MINQLLFIGGGLGVLKDIASTFLSLFQGTTGEIISIISSLALALLNLVLYVFFQIGLIFVVVFYNLLKTALTFTPVPKDSNGDFTIFSKPDGGTFRALQSTMEEGIIPVSILIVLLGIAIVLFIRVFDIALQLGFNSEEAQKRLLIAPLLITLWIPLANLVLVVAQGFTDFFLSLDGSYGSINSLYDTDDIDYNPENSELSVVSLLGSVGPGQSKPGFGSIGNDIGSLFGSSESGLEIAIQTGVAIIIVMFIVPIAIIGAFLAFVRILLLYVFYVLGPLGITMWSINWRSIGKFGERIISNFVLLALFPVVAAILVSIMPVLIVGTEIALIDGAAGTALGFDSGGGSAVLQYVGLDGIIRGTLVGAAVIIISFAPWGLVIGFSRAAGVAATSAAVGGAVTVGGASALAGGASGSASVVSAYRDEDRSATEVAKKGIKDKKEAMKESGSSMLGESSFGDEDGNITASSVASGVGAKSKKSSLTGSAGDTFGSALEGASKATSAKSNYNDRLEEKRAQRRAREADDTADQEELTEEASAISAVATAEEFNGNEREVIEQSDNEIDPDALLDDNGEFRSAESKEAFGRIIRTEINKDSAEDRFAEDTLRRMGDSVTDADHDSFSDAAETLGMEAEYASSVHKELEQYEGEENLAPGARTQQAKENIEDYDMAEAKRTIDNISDDTNLNDDAVIDLVRDDREEIRTELEDILDSFEQSIDDNMEGVKEDDGSIVIENNSKLAEALADNNNKLDKGILKEMDLQQLYNDNGGRTSDTDIMAYQLNRALEQEYSDGYDELSSMAESDSNFTTQFIDAIARSNKKNVLAAIDDGDANVGSDPMMQDIEKSVEDRVENKLVHQGEDLDSINIEGIIEDVVGDTIENIAKDVSDEFGIDQSDAKDEIEEQVYDSVEVPSSVKDDLTKRLQSIYDVAGDEFQQTVADEFEDMFEDSIDSLDDIDPDNLDNKEIIESLDDFAGKIDTLRGDINKKTELINITNQLGSVDDDELISKLDEIDGIDTNKASKLDHLKNDDLRNADRSEILEAVAKAKNS